MTFRSKAGLIFLVFICLFAFQGFAQENADEYRKTIEMADTYFSKGDYINAKASYQIAVRLAPEEQYPKDRLQQSLDMIKAQMYQNSLYTQKIQLADDLLGKNDLEGALRTYQEALAILPGDSYATGKVQAITNNMAGAKLTEENYQKSITKGDQLFKDGNLENALTEYRNAASLKPAETYPKEKVAQVEKTLADRKNLAGTYESLMQAADVAISHNKYDEAITNLEQAVKLKPDDTAAATKLADAKKMKADWDSYSLLINGADNLYISKDFAKAKEKYLQAEAIKPADEYPKRMIEKIDIALMDIAKADRSSYEVTIALADKLFNEQDYERAIVEYNNALRFKPDEEYAKQRITDINNALKLRESQEVAYKQSIAKADKLYNEDQFEDARDEYNKASSIKPLEQYPKVKVDEINTMLSKLASQKGVYDNLIKGADRLFFSDEYVEAREQYRQASDIFPKEQYPLNQITMINEILGIRDKYDKAVTKADMLLSDKKYDEALLEFRNAATINPKEEYPLQKIKEIETIQAYSSKPQQPVKKEDQKVVADEDNKMTEEEYQQGLAAYNKEKVYEVKVDSAGLAAMASDDKQYDDFIATADSLLLIKNYEEALSKYQAAIKLKPGEIYAHGKIDGINKILAEIAAKEAADKKKAELAQQQQQEALAKQQQQEALLKQQQQVALDKKYADAITAADAALQAKDYQKALTVYQSAKSLKPDETYAPGKIMEINGILSEIAAKEAADKQAALIAQQQAALAQQQQAALDKQYSDAITNADKLLQAKDYEKALTAYQSAKSLKPDETYAPGKITEINGILGEIAAKDALEKQQTILAQQQQAALDKQYSDAISSADKLLQAKEYDKALRAYQSAKSLKPDETYAPGKITEINGILSEIAAKDALEKQQAVLAQQQQAALDKQYADAITAADAALQAKDYQKALTVYQSSKSLKPDETFAPGKISEINGILGEIAAKEAAAKQQAILAQQQQATLDKQYADAITNADKLIQAKEYDKALAAYQSAKSLKPDETYAPGKITEVNKILEEIAAKDALEKQQEAIDKKYSDVISTADNAFKAKDYQNALAAYQSALNLKPNMPYVKSRIADINGILGEVAAKEALDKQYADAISEADKAFLAKDYDKALTAYQSALNLKPDESYARNKVFDIQGIKEELRKQQETDNKYNKIIASAGEYMAKEQYDEARAAYQEALSVKPSETLPNQKIAEINQKLVLKAAAQDLSYQAAITSADSYLEQQDFESAKAQYEKALSLKPAEAYPQEKIKLADAQIEKKKQLVQEEYDKAIVDADKFYNTKVYDNALESYRASSALKPNETYPKEMAARILKLLGERSIVQINKAPLVIASNTEHRFEFISVPVKDRKSNYIFFRARNVSKTEYKLIISYGKDQVKNGGFVVKVPAGQDLYEFIVRISAQYKWFSDDNNWISFYPEGGDFEVNLMQISYSD
jgi:tetratricopeptide (TPR) repeat protein